MTRGINPVRLANVIKKLQEERQVLQRKISDIDAIFAKCGISAAAGTAPRRGRPPRAGKAAAAAGKRGRGGRRGRVRQKFETSGAQSILECVKSGGRGGVSSSAISQHWKSEGRAGEPFVTLGHLCKAGKLKKKKLRGQRGSQYTLA